MTEITALQPQVNEAEQLLKQLLTEFTNKINQQQDQINSLNQKITSLSNLPQEIDTKLGELANETKDAFGQIATIIQQLKTETSQNSQISQQPPQESGLMGIIKSIMGALEKTQINPEAGGLSEFDKEIMRTSKQIQLYSLKDALKRVTKASGIDFPPEHIIVEP